LPPLDRDVQILAQIFYDIQRIPRRSDRLDLGWSRQEGPIFPARYIEKIEEEGEFVEFPW